MQDINGATYSDLTSVSFGTSNTSLVSGPSAYYYNEWLPAGNGSLRAVEQGKAYSANYNIAAGASLAYIMKFGPIIGGVFPTAGIVDYIQSSISATPTLNLAPGSLISIYGSSLSQSTAQATALPLPSTLEVRLSR